ncbi:MAG TPA: hypothetical protein VG096_10075 [Bryobacteraceae bacterium]|jgi:hypothetical protein|nr:hypothetical protein [Bryobacteraceae bacterium]
MLPVLAVSVRASVIYDFVGTGSAFTTATQTFAPEPVAFQLTLSDFVNPPLDGPIAAFPCAQFDSSTNCDPAFLGAVFSNQSAGGAFSAQLQFNATNGAGYIFYFPAGAFGAPGVYSANAPTPVFNSGTLTVQTPEPANAILMLLGLVCGSWYLRWPLLPAIHRFSRWRLGQKIQ